MKSRNLKNIAAAFVLMTGGFNLPAHAEVFDPEAQDESDESTLLDTLPNVYCTSKGQVIRVSAYEEGNHSYIYWRESALDNVYYFAITHDNRLLNTAMHAMNGPMQVSIRTHGECHSSSYKGFVNRIQLNP